MKRTVLETENLCYAYPDGTPALNALFLSLREGERIALAGANGSGKTTLLMILAGCLAPASGKITLLGKDVSGEKTARSKRAGLVFQEPDDQLFMPTAEEDVAFGLISKGLTVPDARAAARACLISLGAENLASRPPHRLSGGEKRLVALAGALVMEPEILLLDEPTSSLDPKARRGIMMAIGRMSSSMIIGTHDLDMVLDLCDRVLVMNHGTIASDGSPEEILTDAGLLGDNGLDLPLRFSSPFIIKE